MELRHLITFVKIVESGSYSAAANVCNISQSAVSQQMMSLENDLNTTLFKRESHTIRLTETGEELYKRAKDIVRSVQECKEYIYNLNHCLAGELRIGVGSFIEPYIRKAAIIFMERYPGVRLNVEFGKACRLNQMLREHKLDVAFSMNTAYQDEGIESMGCIPFRICAIMSRKHPLAMKKMITYEDISSHPVIMPDVGDRVFATIKQYIDIDFSQICIKAIVNGADATLNALEESSFITFMPQLCIETHPNLVAIPIEKLNKEMMSNAHWMSDAPIKKSAQEFLEIVKNEIVPFFKMTDRI